MIMVDAEVGAEVAVAEEVEGEDTIATITVDVEATDAILADMTTVVLPWTIAEATVEEEADEVVTTIAIAAHPK